MFLLNSAEVANSYKRNRQNDPRFSWYEPEDTFMLWLSRCDSTLKEPSELPPLLTKNKWYMHNLSTTSLNLVATDLVTTGKAKVFCSRCAAHVPPDQVVRKWDYVDNGNFQCDRLYCTQNHILLSTAHYTAPIRRRQASG